MKGIWPFVLKKQGGKGMKRFVAIINTLLLFSVPCLSKEVKEKVIKLKEIVVTATKTPARIMEAPASVKIITRKDIESSAARTIANVLRNISGVQVYDTYGTGMWTPVGLRGFEPWGSTYVQVMINGVPINDAESGTVHWNIVPLEDVERIEIVKGPMSALYGPNAMGGVINIITKKGKIKPERRVNFSHGSNGAKRYTVGIGGQNGRFNYRLSFNRRDGSGWRHHSEYEANDFGIRLGMEFSEQSDLSFDLYYYDAWWEDPSGLTREQYHKDPKKCLHPWDEDDLNVLHASLTYKRDINDRNRITARLFGFYKDLDCIMTFYGYPTAYFTLIHSLGSEIQHDFRYSLFSRKGYLTSGFFFRRDDVDYKEALVFNGKPVWKTEDSDTDRTSIAFYVQNEFKITEHLNLYLGIRYDWIEHDYDDHMNDSSSTDSVDAISPKFGVSYQFAKSSSIYLNISRAFKPPTLSQLYTYGAWANPDLDPEIATNYEVGLRSEIGKLSFEISAYWMDVDDEIICSYKKYENAGETRHRGVETDLEFRLSKKISFFFSFTYQHVRFEKYKTFDIFLGKPVSYEGNRVPHVPRWIISGGIKTHLPLGLKVTFTGNWRDDEYADPANKLRIPDRLLCDLRLDYEKKWGSFYLLINNLFDKDYIEERWPGWGIAPGAGTRYMIGFSIRF